MRSRPSRCAEPVFWIWVTVSDVTKWFDCKIDKEGRKPLVEEDAVPGSHLRDQLAELGDDNPDLDILEEQRLMKKQARDEKAARQLAKGSSDCM